MARVMTYQLRRLLVGLALSLAVNSFCFTVQGLSGLSGQSRFTQSCHRPPVASPEAHTFQSLVLPGFLCLTLLLALPMPVAAQDRLGAKVLDSYYEDIAKAQAMMRKAEELPAPPQEERLRRQNTPSEQVLTEDWYRDGRTIFINACATCHTFGGNIVRLDRTLHWDDLERWGYRKDPSKFAQIIRYGKGKMKGYASDCPKAQEEIPELCGPRSLPDFQLRDVEDFIINRANMDWKGKG